MTLGRPQRGALLIAGIVVLIDQLTKQWASNALTNPDRNIHVVGSLQFNLAHNTGMAFSQATGLGPIIGVVALFVVVALLISIGHSSSPLYMPAVGLIIGGAVGNVIDRLFRSPGWFRGGVIDFIDVQWWPIFNIADIGVTVGGILLLVSTLRPEPKPAPAGAVGADRPEVVDDDADGAADEPLDDEPVADEPIDDAVADEPVADRRDEP